MTTEQSNQLQALYDKLINIDDGKRTIIYLGNSNSYNLSNYEGYQDFTINNIIVEVLSISTSGYTQSGYSGNISCAANISKTYNPSTGALTIGNLSCSQINTATTGGSVTNSITTSISYKVYLIF